MARGCEQFRELLSALVDDELDEARRKVVSAHLLTCEECGRLAGELLAAKGVARREAEAVALPLGFHERLRVRLNQVDEVRGRVRASRPLSRVIGIAAAGTIAVSIAIILSTIYLMNADQALTLARLHQEIAGLPVAAVAPDGLAAVSCDPRQPWVEARRALVRLDGLVVSYVLYDVGGCPVSVFEGPADWDPYRTGWLLSERMDGLEVRQVGQQSMTGWRQGALRRVVVAEMPPEQLVAAARAYMAGPGRSSGL
ncbi:MAG: anti-sigma factor [Armatimonadota bacterium]